MRYILLLGVLCFSTTCLSAQDLTAADSTEIQQRAVRYVRQFEGLLNLVAQPDKYFRKYSFAKLIRSFYEEQSDYQIFRDSLVTIEDDLNPDAQPNDNNLLTIKDYLRTFFSLYEKSPVASVFFSNYEVSPVQQGDFTYVDVFFVSEFTNAHRFYPDQSYPIRHKKATLRAQRQQDGWQVNITDVGFYSPDKDSSVPSEEATSPVAPETTTEDIYPASPPDSSLEANAASFTSGTALNNISDALSDSSQTWQVLEALNRGKDYQLSLYNPGESVNSIPSVGAPVVVELDDTQQSDEEAFRGFVPLIRRVGESSVQVLFDNPAEDSLLVELLDGSGQVLHAEKAAGQSQYARSINLMALDPGRYEVKVSNDNYSYSAKVRYQPTGTDDTEAVADAEVNVFEGFDPYIMKRKGQSSVQVVFNNPAQDSLLVELMDTSGRVLYSEKAAGRQKFARSVNIENLPRGSYRVRITDEEDYKHTVRIYH